MYRVGIIGCGKPWRSEGATGFGMSHAHAAGYQATGQCQLVALADISEENARAFQERHGGDQIFDDYRQMLAEARLDIVSICTWPALHAPMVIAAAEAGVRAIHCEKPMAPTYGESRRMLAACEQAGAQLTFNHQRRFGRAWRSVKELLAVGTIGQLERMEAHCPDLFDWGTHWFDMLNFYNGECPVEWLIGQVDLRGAHSVFGVMLEGQGLAHFRYANGVTATLTTGPVTPWQATNRLYGSEGVIELVVGAGERVRYLGAGT
ncbi:MAG: Gfo/Idh/MocA family oxidoreductase, partial [Roseiflexaceae bacterium]|nr:Gfo/Idh/MocA family oxidoreductase [Roseiflexaceae bacterium]